MTWELEATVPAGFMAVSNGALASDTKDARGNAHAAIGEKSVPARRISSSLVVAPLAKIHDTWQERARRLLRLSRRQRARLAALSRHAGHDRRLLASSRASTIPGRSMPRRPSPISSAEWRTSARRRSSIGCPTPGRIRIGRGISTYSSRTSSRISGSATT